MRVRVDQARQDDRVAEILHRLGGAATADRSDPALLNPHPAIFDRLRGDRQHMPCPKRDRRRAAADLGHEECLS